MEKYKRVFLVVLFFLICFIISVYLIDNYYVGDFLYVWVKNGLKLWEKLNINFKLIELILFGWKIIVNEKIFEIFNVKVNVEIL